MYVCMYMCIYRYIATLQKYDDLSNNELSSHDTLLQSARDRLVSRRVLEFMLAMRDKNFWNRTCAYYDTLLIEPVRTMTRC